MANYKKQGVWCNARYRQLVVFKAFAGLRGDASRNYLNFAWWAIDPIIAMTVYYVVFGLLFQRGTEDFVPFLLIGLVFWQWFGNTVRHASNAIRSSTQLMLQVDLPKTFFPAVTVVMDTVKSAIVMALLLIFLWIYGFPVSITYLALPALLLVQGILVVGASYIVAGLTPFVPDLRFLIDAFITLLFFLSGIFYSGRSIPIEYQEYFYINPMATMVESYRDVLMYQAWPDWERLLGVGIFAAAVTVVGHLLIASFDYTYPRLVGR